MRPGYSELYTRINCASHRDASHWCHQSVGVQKPSLARVLRRRGTIEACLSLAACLLLQAFVGQQMVAAICGVNSV